MAVPDRSSVFWKALYALVGVCTIASLTLLRFANVSVLPWAVGVIAFGVTGLGVIRWEQLHLAGRGAPHQHVGADYWTTRRRIAAGGGLSVLAILAVVVAFTVPSVLGFTALVLMVAVMGLLLYVFRDTA